MRKEIVTLIESARNLNIRLVDTSGKPNHSGVKIGGKREDFPPKLKQVALALEGVDRAGSDAFEGLKSHAAMDPIRLRMALDGIFRWMKAMGIAVEDPHDIVASALGMSKARINERRNALPKYKNAGFRNSHYKSMASSSGKPETSVDSLREQLKQSLHNRF